MVKRKTNGNNEKLWSFVQKVLRPHPHPPTSSRWKQRRVHQVDFLTAQHVQRSAATISLVLDVIKRPDLQIYWHSPRLLKPGLAFAMFDFSKLSYSPGLIFFNICSFFSFFIRPRSDHSLPMSVTHWLTDSLTHELVEDWMNWLKCADQADYADYAEYTEYLECAEYAEYAGYAGYAEYA